MFRFKPLYDAIILRAAIFMYINNYRRKIKMYNAIYARQSIEKVDSISVESQIDFCRYETREENYKEYIDRGFSGKNTNRPAFEEMFLDIKKGLIKKVIVYKLDRISRSILDFSNMMEVFQKYHVEFISSTEKFDTSTPIGRAMLNICIVFAQLERETIQKRVADTYYSRSKKGFYMGGRVPYGFALKGTTIDGIRTSKYVPVDAEIKQIKLMYSIYSHPTKTLGDILRYFNKHGIKHLRGKNWCTARISELLRNPIYVKADSEIYNFYKNQGSNIINDISDFVGENACYLYKGETDNKKQYSLENKYLVLAPHKGIVNSSEWLKCRIKSINNKQVATNNKGKNSWLVGKVKCGNCGYALVVRKSDRRRKNVVRYFVCSNKNTNRFCEGCGTVKADDLESFMFESIKNKLIKFNVLTCVKKHIFDPKINECKIKISQINKKIDDLIKKLLTANDILMKYVNEHIEKLDKEREQLNKELLSLSNEKLSTDMDKITNYISRWGEICVEDKILVADALIKVIHIAGEKIEITWKI